VGDLNVGCLFCKLPSRVGCSRSVPLEHLQSGELNATGAHSRSCAPASFIRFIIYYFYTIVSLVSFDSMRLKT